MQLSDAFLALGQESFGQLLRSISIGRLKTYQLYDRIKARAHTAKLNSESLRKAAPRLWPRIEQHDEEFCQDLAQAILVSELDMIRAVLDFLEIPNEDGFFAKDVEAAKYLTEGWQQRVWDQFHGKYAPASVQFYINHLAWELDKNAAIFVPSGPTD
ncbi:MAG: hypothetical protein IT160_18475 [Bryobacterales bacterium]|nr:hypothetical protein [Bryobacterales bacterium]